MRLCVCAWKRHQKERLISFERNLFALWLLVSADKTRVYTKITLTLGHLIYLGNMCLFSWSYSLNLVSVFTVNSREVNRTLIIYLIWEITSDLADFSQWPSFYLVPSLMSLGGLCLQTGQNTCYGSPTHAFCHSHRYSQTALLCRVQHFRHHMFWPIFWLCCQPPAQGTMSGTPLHGNACANECFSASYFHSYKKQADLRRKWVYC